MLSHGSYVGFYYKNYGTYNVKNSFTTVLSTYVYFENNKQVPEWDDNDYCKIISPESNYNCTSYTDLTEIRKCI